MHATTAFVNGAGEKFRNRASRKQVDSLTLLNTLLATASSALEAAALDKQQNSGRALDRSKSKNEKQAEDSKAPSASNPGRFKNDPDDPNNPNEARERHKIRPRD